MHVTQNSEVVPLGFDYKSHKVRVVHIDGKPHWVAKDVCDILGLGDANKACSRLHEGMVSLLLLGGVNGGRKLCITEPGLYLLLLRSNKPEAKPFQVWVTTQVLPAIQQKAYYDVTPPAHGKQLSLFAEDFPQTAEYRKLQRLVVDVALEAKKGSKVYRLIRELNPLLFGGKGGAV